MLVLRNTLTRKKEKFSPIDPSGKTVKIYSCGPTVYDFAHIGNFRSFLLSDLLVRVLEMTGFEVKKVQNITDVGHLTDDDFADAGGEDKIAKKARLEKKDPFAIARFFENAFFEDEKCLRIRPPNAGRPRATEFIREQLALVKILIRRGFAYKKNGSVYFRTEKFKNYGKLSGNSLAELEAGARIEINDEKESPLDFALWKRAEPEHLMQWDFETGEKIDPKNPAPHAQPGFPGWHIECSAMSAKIFAPEIFEKIATEKFDDFEKKPFFDIHTGGEDNIFPHHECEIAQNEASFGGTIPFWLHAKHLLVDGKKMSKSDGNFFTIRDLLDRGFAGEEIRFALISAHYRTALNFTFDSLEMAKNSIARLVEARRIFGEIAGSDFRGSGGVLCEKWRKNFKTALQNDLDTPTALATAFEVVNFGFKIRDEQKLTPEIAGEIADFLENDFDPIFDIFPNKKTLAPAEIAEIERKIAERTRAREEKNWKKSDELRDELEKKFKIELIDENGGTRWR